MAAWTVYLNNCVDLPARPFCALPMGRVFDGQPPQCWDDLGDSFAFYRAPDTASVAGFGIRDLARFDVDAKTLPEIWTGPRFTAPLLGLVEVSAAEIILAARSHFGGRPSLNRFYFELAMASEGEDALTAWTSCLECGDSMAHFALGYTLYELGRFQPAYGHLRYYIEIAPHNPWNWCWLGKAAAAIGETAEACNAYERAIELTMAGGDETDAPELLDQIAGAAD